MHPLHDTDVRDRFATVVNAIVGHIRVCGFALILAVMAVCLPETASAQSRPQAFSCSGESSGIPRTECEALVELYNATGGPAWEESGVSDISGWSQITTGAEFPLSPCDWAGVICRSKTDGSGDVHVVGLGLGGVNMTGTLPGSALAKLPFLVGIWLAGNNLEGEIPSELAGDLAYLRVVALYGNEFSGSVPEGLLGDKEAADLFDLPIQEGLWYFDDPDVLLFDNNLTGPLPQSWGRTDMKRLRLQGNDFSGPIPKTYTALTQTSVSLGNAGDLCVDDPAVLAWLDEKSPNHGYPECTIPEPSPACANIQGIPTSECEALKRLYDATVGDNWTRGKNWFTHDFPCGGGSPYNVGWGGVSCEDGHVDSIFLNDMGLDGEIPGAIFSSLPRLRTLNLSGNRLRGTIPPQLADLDYLYSLALSRNQLTGSIPAGLLGEQDTIHFISLSLSENDLSGALPANIGGPAGEEIFVFVTDNPKLSGPIPANYYEDVEELYFAGTQICEPIDPDTQEWLDTREPVSSEWRTWRPCACQGPLDEVQSRECNALVRLYQGTAGENWTAAPDWLDETKPHCSWTGVRCDDDDSVVGLTLTQQNLLGDLTSPSWRDLARLEELRLRNNLLDGPLPPDLALLPRLVYVDLAQNLLEGSIPEGLLGTEAPNVSAAALASTLILSDNLFTGRMPVNPGARTIVNLDVSETFLTGPLPMGYRFLRNVTSFGYADSPLCAPDDEAFQQWLNAIPQLNGDAICGEGDLPQVMTPDGAFVEGVRAVLDGNDKLTFYCEAEAGEGALGLALITLLREGRYGENDAFELIFERLPTKIAKICSIKDEVGAAAQQATTADGAPDLILHVESGAGRFAGEADALHLQVTTLYVAVDSIGTNAFVVGHDTAGDVTEIEVLQGSVTVTPHDNLTPPITLSAGDRVTVDADGPGPVEGEVRIYLPAVEK